MIAKVQCPDCGARVAKRRVKKRHFKAHETGIGRPIVFWECPACSVGSLGGSWKRLKA